MNSAWKKNSRDVQLNVPIDVYSHFINNLNPQKPKKMAAHAQNMYNIAYTFNEGFSVMRRLVIGYSWTAPQSVRPAALSAIDIQGEYPRSLQRVSRDCWVVDYEFAPYGFTRVQSPEMRWQKRLPNTLHLYPPHTIFWEDTRKERGRRHSAWIEFIGAEEASLERLISPRYCFVRFLDPLGRAANMFLNAARAGHDMGERGFWSAQASLCELIGIMLGAEHVDADTYRIRESGKTDESSEFVRKVESVLLDNISSPLTLEKCAQSLDVSVSTLAHRYRREAGETPMTTLARFRIQRAKMLLHKGYPLKAIADQFCFCDEFHLSKTFKRIEGVSPRKYIAHSKRG
jgi:AraC-like DNA-binding protein